MVKVLIAGDFVPSHRVAEKINEHNYDCLDGVRQIIQTSDYAIVNLESPVVVHKAKPIIKTGPNLKSTEITLECLRQAGFNCVSLANNHFRDYGQTGVEDTINSCIRLGIDFVGGGRNLIEATKTHFLTVNGHKIGIINICENEWSIATSEYGGAAPLNPVQNYYTIKDASKISDFVIVIVHGGIEGYQYPTIRMQETYRFFVDAGANVVINHHQHCFSGYEIYKNAPIFYGLGNFCFDKSANSLLWTEGYMVNLVCEKSVDFEIIPYSQCAKDARVELLSGSAKEHFNKKIKEINQIISNSSLLCEQLSRHSECISRSRLLEFSSIQNRILKGLQIKGMLPILMSKKTLKNIYDVVNCESHREVILEVLKKYI